MRDPGCSCVHAKFKTLRYQSFFPPTNTLPCLTIFSLPPFTMVLSWQTTFNSIKLVFQFLSMSLNFLLNRRGSPDTTTFFPQCNLKSLAIHIVVLVPWLLLVLIYLRIILEESAPARGNRPTLYFILSFSISASPLIGMERLFPSYISQVPLVSKTDYRTQYIHRNSKHKLLIVDMVKENNQVSKTPTINELSRSKTPLDRTHSPWNQE